MQAINQHTDHSNYTLENWFQFIQKNWKTIAFSALIGFLISLAYFMSYPKYQAIGLIKSAKVADDSANKFIIIEDFSSYRSYVNNFLVDEQLFKSGCEGINYPKSLRFQESLDTSIGDILFIIKGFSEDTLINCGNAIFEITKQRQNQLIKDRVDFLLVKKNIIESLRKKSELNDIHKKNYQTYSSSDLKNDYYNAEVNLSIIIDTANKNPTLLAKPIKLKLLRDYKFFIYCTAIGILSGIFFGILVCVVSNYWNYFLRSISHK